MKQIEWRQFRQVSLVASGVAALFILTYTIIYLGQRLSWWDVPTEGVAVVMAALVAAILPAGPLWYRLARVKLWDIEIELASVAVQLPDVPPLNSADAIKMGSSYFLMIIGPIQQAMKQGPKARLITLNLNNGPAWWSTRLFLVAALTENFTKVEQIVFLENCAGPDDCYVGSTTPAALQRRLANKQGFLKQAYAHSQQRESPFPIAQQFIEWFNLQPTPETEQQTSMTKAILREWLEEDLNKEYVDWQAGPPPIHMIHQMINHPEPFVPLVQCGRLRLLVDRQDLEHSLANHIIKPPEGLSNTKS
jgi:hypothetical protein